MNTRQRQRKPPVKVAKARTPAQLYCNEHGEKLLAERHRIAPAGYTKLPIGTYQPAVKAVFESLDEEIKEVYREKAKQHKESVFSFDDQRM